jgi:hypothetical protein
MINHEQLFAAYIKELSNQDLRALASAKDAETISAVCQTAIAKSAGIGGDKFNLEVMRALGLIYGGEL